jgi:hypothetical protein
MERKIDVTKIIILLLVLFIPLQIIFAIIINIQLAKFNFKKQIEEKDAQKLISWLKFVLWVPYTTSYFNRMRKLYYLTYASPLVHEETKEKLYKMMRRRLVRGLTPVKRYPNN